jgi:hypothetical protein
MTRPTPITALNRAPAFFAHSGRAAYEEGDGYVTACAICQREVTAPLTMQGSVIWCLYCGMERGQVPEIEVWACEFSFGITAGECAEIRQFPKDRDIDDLFWKWAERNAMIPFTIE